MSTRIDVTFDPAPAEYSAKTTHAGAGLPEKPASQTGRTPMVATFGPIESEPRSLYPPYDDNDSVLAEGPRPGESTDMWRTRLRLDRKVALYAPLSGLDVSAYEYAQLRWLCEWEDHTVAVIAALLHRARAAAPLAEGGHTPAGGEH